MRRIARGISAFVGAAGLLVAGSSTALADNGAGRYRIHAAPFTTSVCGFDLAVSSIVDREFQSDEYDASGFLTRSTVTGPLFSTVTRVDNGKSIVVNDTGKGVYDYRADGSFTLTSTGHLMYGLHPGDTPGQPGLYNTNGRTVIEFSATGQRTVTVMAAQVDNLCTMLS